MNGLVLFQNKAPSNTIDAQALDANFKRCMPIPQDGNAAQYKVGYTPSGWYLEIFPGYPPSDEPYVLTSSNGSLQWLPFSQFEAGGTPPGGTAGWKQVERCDGKTMYVWGTDWA